MKKSTSAPLCVLAGILIMHANVSAADLVSGTAPEDVLTELKASFNAKGAATMDRFDQSAMQKTCSEMEMTGTPLTKEQSDAITTEAMASIKRPADGRYLGDWKAGEKIAQNGRGLQSSDKPGAPNGGNCYACHNMSKAEISFGNIGPSLLHYGKERGTGQKIQDFVWNKIYNSHSSTACSKMPRFGAAGILTETQMKDVMALLFDPESPVNKDGAAQ